MINEYTDVHYYLELDFAQGLEALLAPDSPLVKDMQSTMHNKRCAYLLSKNPLLDSFFTYGLVDADIMEQKTHKTAAKALDFSSKSNLYYGKFNISRDQDNADRVNEFSVISAYLTKMKISHYLTVTGHRGTECIIYGINVTTGKEIVPDKMQVLS